MKRLPLMLLGLCLAAPLARAEVVGRTQTDFIHCYTADNGQTLYYLSSESSGEEEGSPQVLLQDVNFDGHDDVLVCAALGAGNLFQELFVWDGTQYVLAGHEACPEAGLPNLELHPEKGLVSCSVSQGWAGMLHETWIFCWEGTQMKLVRHAVSGPVHTLSEADDILTQTVDYGTLHMQVTEPVYDSEGLRADDVVLWEVTLPAGDAFEAATRLLEQEHEVLWRGL